MNAIVEPEDPDALGWEAQGLCRRVETISVDDFFYEGRWQRNSKAQIEHIRRLRTMCKACPVRQLCDEEADRNKEDGFWAGLTAEERKTRRRAHNAKSA